MKTERQKVRELLEYSISGMSPDELSDRLSDRDNLVTEGAIIEHIEHIKRSLSNEDRELLALPPECHECGYNKFDSILNVPGKCPSSNCHSERIAQPKFKIE